MTATWPGDTVTINVPGVGNVTYVGTTFYLANGQRVFTPTDGQVLQSGTFVSSTFVTTQGSLDVGDLIPPCFTAGTMIGTPDGARPVETLAAGDLVTTLDHGAQALRWVGRRTVDGMGRFAPVRFEAGVIGNERPLTVSPQHRVLVRGWRAELHFGQPEVLVPAVHLVGARGVVRVPVERVEYFHLLFAGHQIVVSEGAPTESFYPGSWIIANDRATYSEVVHLFPELIGQASGAWPLARPVPKRTEARALVASFS